MFNDLYDWQMRFNQEGMSLDLRLELLELLKPYVTFKPPFRMLSLDQTGEPTSSNARIKDIVDWEIVLGSSDVHDVMKALRSEQQWIATLPSLLPNLTALLRDCLDFMRLLEGADDRSDLSYVHQPSIAEHSQNQAFRQWTALIDLTRDALRETETKYSKMARAEGLAVAHISISSLSTLVLFCRNGDRSVCP